MFYSNMYDLSLSRISLGTAPFGSSIPRQTAFDILDQYLLYGGNLLDTAAVYGLGLSEKTIGTWMQKRGVRNRVYISTKGAHPSLPDWKPRVNDAAIRSDIEDSLRNLGTDYIDIYYLHRDDESRPVSEIMPILHRFVCEGKVRHLGASNWTVSRIDEANTFARSNGLSEFSFSQIMWSAAYINKSNVYDQTLVVMDEHEYSGYCHNNIPVMAYSSQAQGLFSHIQQRGYEALSDSLLRTYINDGTRDRAEKILALARDTGLSPTAISLGYLLYSKIIAFPIIGVSSLSRLDESMQILNLTKELFDTLQ